MLTWLDERNNSFFSNITWNNNLLSFNILARRGANNLRAMLPVNAGTGQLISITMNGSAITYSTQTIKGIQYAFFPAARGSNSYIANYTGLSTRVANPVTTVKGEPVITTTDDQKTTTEAQKTATKVNITGVRPVIEKLSVNVMPNPSASYFNMIINSDDANPVTVRVLDIFGRLIEVHEKITSTGIIRLGLGWRGGTYFAEVIQGDQRKVVMIVKAN